MERNMIEELECDLNPAEQILVEAGLDKIPWGIRVIEAERDSSFCEQDRDDSSSWTTCACGYYKEIPRGPSRPLDETLRLIGEDFLIHVDNNDFVGAARVICEIDARVKEIMG
jgi:hypothetical protein